MTFIKPVFFHIDELSLGQVRIFVRGMYEVARADEEIRREEEALLKAFYEQCRRDVDGLTSYAELVSRPFDEEEARRQLDSRELKRAFLVSCLYLSFADGDLSEVERATIRRLATAVGADGEDLSETVEFVKDSLFRRLAKVQNLEALQEVLREMDPAR
ncbi:MAG: TerB family tellurite resistance protein [Deltaproteobacteria bacterium]|nr:TerB family tellurite resistance protein [Deltaproteobacteria bacterium]